MRIDMVGVFIDVEMGRRVQKCSLYVQTSSSPAEEGVHDCGRERSVHCSLTLESRVTNVSNSHRCGRGGGVSAHGSAHGWSFWERNEQLSRPRCMQ